MEHIAELDRIVTGFNITEQCIDCMCGKELVRLINSLRILSVSRQFLRKKAYQEN